MAELPNGALGWIPDDPVVLEEVWLPGTRFKGLTAAAITEPSALPPATGARVPKLSLQVPGLDVW